MKRLLPRHLRGLSGWDLVICIAVTPLLIPLWTLGWLVHRVDDIREWWWTG